MRSKVQQFLQSLEARNFSANTVRAYWADLQDFLSFIRTGLGPRQLTRHHISEYLVHLNAKYSKHSSVRRKLAAVKSFTRWLMAEGIITQDVAASVKPPRSPVEIQEWPSEDEMSKLMGGKTVSAFPERDHLIIELLCGTGMRVQELSGVNLDDFRDEDAVLVRGKAKKERLVIFGECAQDALQAYLPVRRKMLRKLKRTTNALLFGLHGRSVERLTVRSISRIVKQIARAKGLPPKQQHPHAFRHACASYLINNGAAIMTVQKLLGHANLSTTERYTHISVARMLQAYNAAHPQAGKEKALTSVEAHEAERCEGQQEKTREVNPSPQNIGE